MKKKNTLLVLIGLIFIAALGYAYTKYNRYLPTTQPSPHPALSDQEIASIRAERPITLVKVYKSQRSLALYHQQKLIKSYDMRLGFNPVGHKIQEGDGKTPEGRYVLDWRNPKSQFYKSIHISYPNKADLAKAQSLGVSAGGDIMIHGSANLAQLKILPQLMSYLPRQDWTLGCIAVSNVDMDEIWKLVNNGTEIEIYP